MAKTRKQKGVMTIPELRRAFDHMETFTARLMTKGGDANERRKAFQAEWKRIFHRSVDDKAADAYLAFEAKKHKKSSTRKMRGGYAASPLGGAPLDYATRPGLPGPYGVFPAYVNSGLDMYDTINKDSLTETCGQDITPKIAEDMGSNQVQKGGKRRSTSRKSRSNKRSTRKTSRRNRKQMGGFPTMSEFVQGLTFRPFSASVPTTSFYDGTMAFKAQPLPLSPTAATGYPPFLSYKASTLDAVATEINRDLKTEMRS